MLELSLSHDPIPVLLYARPQPEAAVTEPQPTNFGCVVTLTSPDERVRSGGLVAVWQTALFKTTYPADAPVEDGDGEWRVLHTIVVPIREDDFVVAEGSKQSYAINFILPPDLTMSRTTPWERVAHLVYVFALEPSPTYSVIPAFRPEYVDEPVRRDSNGGLSGGSSESGRPEKERKGSLFGSLKRLSIGSLSSGRSSRAGDKTPEKVQEIDDLADPPMPNLQQPFIAEIHKEIIVISTTDERGHVHGLNVDSLVKNDLGRIKLHASSDMFLTGSSFSCCVLMTNLNPMATIHAFRITLTQRLIKADESTTLTDRFLLYSQGRSYMLGRSTKPSEEDILWRGEGARGIDAAHGHSRAGAPAPSDSVHIVCAPRMPSTVLGARPTRHNFDQGLSTNDHALEFTFYWSIFGQDGSGQPLPAGQEGEIRSTTILNRPTVGTCGFNWASVVVPKYGVYANPIVNLDSCMEPFKPGTEPSCFTLKAESWVERGGKTQRVRQPYHPKTFDLRQHQLDTDSLCVCFYPMAGIDAKPSRKVEKGELDLALFKPIPGGPANFAAEKQKREDDWWKAHKGERKAVPGFGHFLLDECHCARYRAALAEGLGDSTGGEPVRRGSKVDLV